MPGDLEEDFGESSVQAFGDVRLEREDALAREAGAEGLRGIELVRAAYAKLGERVFARLEGDFAIVIADPARGLVLAARDAFGVKPLVHRAVGRELLFARDPATVADVEPRAALDDEGIFDFLEGRSPSAVRTMFAGVSRLPAGHLLRATARGVSVERWWQPSFEASPRDMIAHRHAFAERLRASVAACLDPHAPVLVHVSGGLDSAAVACVAAEIGDAERLRFVHAHSPESDERPWVRAVEEKTRVHVITETSIATDDIDDPLDPSHPYRHPLAAQTRVTEQLAAREGARAILTGIGGDELLFERGIFSDLASRGRMIALLEETVLAGELYSSRRGGTFLREALVSLVPDRIRAVRRSLRAQASRPWLRERRAASIPPTPELPFTSHVQRVTWEWLTGPALAATLEAEERALRRGGLELRCPLLDRSLAELVLALPYEERMPHGRMKALLRDALGDTLPARVRERRRVTGYGSAATVAIASKVPALSAVLREGPWRSDRFVDRAEATALLESLDRGAAPADVAETVWDIASLELWLRARG